MTELEKIKYAKSFIDKLAEGVNPTDGSVIPAHEVARNPRLSKCFSYVADVLAKVMERPALVDEMYKTSDWIVTPEVLSKIECTTTSTSISAFAKRISDALNCVKKFTAAELKAWLFDKGYLTKIDHSQLGRVTRPTHEGMKIGILTEEASTVDGLKYYIRCNNNAQKFIRDHLEEIVRFAKANGFNGYTALKVTAALPFELAKGELDKFEFSQQPIVISKITDKINALKSNLKMRNLKATELTEWLYNIGLLEMQEIDGKAQRVPSPKGKATGLRLWRHPNGEYSCVLYDSSAQKFIIENIHEVIKII